MLSNEELARAYPGLALNVAAAAHAAAQAAIVNVSKGGTAASVHTPLSSSAVPAAADPSHGPEPDDAGSDAAAVHSALGVTAGGKGGKPSSAEVHEPDGSAGWSAEDKAAPGLQASPAASGGQYSTQGAAGASQAAPSLQGQGQPASSLGAPSRQEVLAQGLPSTQAFSMAMTGSSSSSSPGAPARTAFSQRPAPGMMSQGTSGVSQGRPSQSISMLGQGRGGANVGAAGIGGGAISRGGGRLNHASVAYQQWRGDVRDVREAHPPPPAPDVRELDPEAQQAYHRHQMEQRRRTDALREAGRSAIRARGPPGGAQRLQPRHAQGSQQVGIE